MDRGTIKPVRTALFVAGSNEDELAKSPDYGADLVVIDIEEPRTPYPEHERERTRGLVSEFLSSAPTGAGNRCISFVCKRSTRVVRGPTCERWSSRR